jgi:hypothetical protein
MKEMEIKNKAQMQMALQEAEMLKDVRYVAVCACGVVAPPPPHPLL